MKTKIDTVTPEVLAKLFHNLYEEKAPEFGYRTRKKTRVWDRSSKNSKFVDDVALKNVEITIEDIKNKSNVLNEMLQNKEIGIVGAMYNIATGRVNFLT